MKSTYVGKADIKRKWFLVDAKGIILGRLATRVATILMGKHKPTFAPFYDMGDFVIVINAGQVSLSGEKASVKKYARYSGYPGGHKEIKYLDLLKKRPEDIIKNAVRSMLPKRALGRHMLKKLKVYGGDKHPHKAQNPQILDLQYIRSGRICLMRSGQQEDVKPQRQG